MTSVAAGGSAIGAGGADTGGSGVATGGQSATGGTSAANQGGSGGAVSVTGGASVGGTSTGGTKAAGGQNATGGTSTGGTKATGGQSAVGGTSTGGTKATGGQSAVGGTTPTNTGGRTATGGTTPATTGGAGGAIGGASGAATGGSAGTSATCDLPAKFQWSSTAPIIVPVSDATHNLVAVKDPTVVRYDDRWHVFASSVSSAGAYNMVYTSFADWAAAPTAPFSYMDQTAGFNTYIAAPQVFYFTPQKKWYLVFQSGPPMYSTTTDITNSKSWSAPASFYATTPAIVTQNNGWLDFWVICDAQYCHLFFSDDAGRWYKSKTSISSFPAGFGDPVIVMQDSEAGRLFEACNVYKVKGTNKYLALIEAYDSTSNWRRYFRSWTATSLEGPWTPLADSGTNPLAGKQNVTFTGTVWTSDISHGEMVRDGYDENMTIDACKLQYLYQGFDPATDTTNYNAIPWKLGLLTAK